MDCVPIHTGRCILGAAEAPFTARRIAPSRLPTIRLVKSVTTHRNAPFVLWSDRTEGALRVRTANVVVVSGAMVVMLACARADSVGPGVNPPTFSHQFYDD